MASIAVLPVLIGLAVDYAIQFQARFDESAGRREPEPRRRRHRAAARVGGPTIATAGLATAAGFLVLLLSPVPMVRGLRRAARARDRARARLRADRRVRGAGALLATRRRAAEAVRRWLPRTRAFFGTRVRVEPAGRGRARARLAGWDSRPVVAVLDLAVAHLGAGSPTRAERALAAARVAPARSACSRSGC